MFLAQLLTGHKHLGVASQHSTAPSSFPLDPDSFAGCPNQKHRRCGFLSFLLLCICYHQNWSAACRLCPVIPHSSQSIASVIETSLSLSPTVQTFYQDAQTLYDPALMSAQFHSCCSSLHPGPHSQMCSFLNFLFSFICGLLHMLFCCYLEHSFSTLF